MHNAAEIGGILQWMRHKTRYD